LGEVNGEGEWEGLGIETVRKVKKRKGREVEKGGGGI